MGGGEGRSEKERGVVKEKSGKVKLEEEVKRLKEKEQGARRRGQTGGWIKRATRTTSTRGGRSNSQSNNRA